jgi:membrane dipeptidase
VAGIEHIGLGGDYDGASCFPAGMEDVSGYPLLFDELRGRGWSEPELEMVGSGNVLRAMRDMELVAEAAGVVGGPGHAGVTGR